MRGLALVLEVFVKVTIAIAAGFGSGILAFGITLQQRGTFTGFDELEKTGPPPAETFLAVGVGLLVLAGLLLVMSVGPLAQRRWFVSPEGYDSAPPRGSVE